ncbi:MAG: BMP family ABC transporter substrate-binding protein [bacterium]|nr:BMP family ABC transporter substrate-binding protein [bacterium]
MKKLTAVLLVALLLVAAVFAQSSGETTSSKATKIGFVVINDESDQGYTWNFTNGMNEAIAKLKAEGYNVELMTKKNTTESAICKDNNIELAEEGCEIIFNNSYGFEPYMLEAAKEYPKTKFVGMTNCGSQVDDNPNTYNAFAAIYEARYVAGIAAGMKLQQEINEGKISLPSTNSKPAVRPFRIWNTALRRSRSALPYIFQCVARNSPG